MRESLEERDVREEEEAEEVEETIAEMEEIEDQEITENPGNLESPEIEMPEIPEITEIIGITEITEIAEIETTIVIEKIALREEITTEMIVQETKEDVNVMKIMNTKTEEIEETTLTMKIKLKPDMVMIETKEEKIITVIILLLR